MQMMKVVAKIHGMVCLLHEKPFAGVNGSGKHNNWSISTDTGVNLLEPGATPSHNTQFLLFLTAVIKAVDEYQELLRVSVASAGNDHRLGANEAPPAIISMFLGDELEAIVESIIDGTNYEDIKKKKMSIGAAVIPSISQDTTDRNRTSPFAFTGNKFEFRSLGSSASISGPNVILNTIVAEELDKFSDELEKADDFDKALASLLKRELTAHKRIIFNGNGYSEEWVKEAEKRGLKNLKSTVDALPAFIDKKAIDLFTKHNVFTEQELFSRYDIQLENYYKVIDIEALTMDAMVKKNIMAAANDYQYTLAETINAKAATGLSVDYSVEKKRLEQASKLTYDMDERLEKLEADIEKAKELEDTYELAKFHHDVIFADMNELREVVDELETVVPSDIWPYPTYGEILYSVK
jgi:glutamine synthetase